MADASPYYAIRQLSVDTVSWTAVVAPIDCNGVGWYNKGNADLKTRSDSTNPATEKLLPAAGAFSQEGIMAPRLGTMHADSTQGTRFRVGQTIAFLQAVAGTGPVVLTFA